MEKTKIGVDIDDVIVDFFEGFISFYNKLKGTNHSFEEIVLYEVWDLFGISKKEATEIGEMFHLSQEIKQTNVFEGAKDVLNILSENNELVVISSRHPKLKELTLNYFKTTFPEINFKILFSGDFWRNGKTKAELCLELGIKVFLEDNPKTSLECAEKGVKVLLFDKPWNRNLETHPNIIRVYNWKEVLNKINQYGY